MEVERMIDVTLAKIPRPRRNSTMSLAHELSFEAVSTNMRIMISVQSDTMDMALRA